MATTWPPRMIRLTSTAGCQRTLFPSMTYTPAGFAVRPNPPPEPEPLPAPSGGALSSSATSATAYRGGRNDGHAVALVWLAEHPLHGEGVPGLLHQLVRVHVRPPLHRVCTTPLGSHPPVSLHPPRVASGGARGESVGRECPGLSSSELAPTTQADPKMPASTSGRRRHAPWPAPPLSRHGRCTRLSSGRLPWSDASNKGRLRSADSPQKIHPEPAAGSDGGISWMITKRPITAATRPSPRAPCGRHELAGRCGQQ